MPPLLQRKPLLAIVAGFIFVAGALAGHRHAQTARAALVESLQITARRCAVAFDPADVAALSGTRADLTSPAYAAIKDHLHRLRAADPDVHSVYLLRLRPPPGRAIYLADSEPDASPQSSPPGAPWTPTAFLPELLNLNELAGFVTPTPYRDEFGIWVTAFAAVDSPARDRPRYILGVDIPGYTWHRTLWSAGLSTAGYVWMLLLLPLVAYLASQRQLQQGEALRNLTEAMEQGHSPIMILDLELRIEYANARFCRLLGYSRRELLGCEWRDLYGQQASAVLADQVTTIRSGRGWTGEWLMPRKDGALLPVGGGVTPVKNRQGRVRSFVGVFEDMTEVRRTEAVLREAKERAEAGDRAKGRFLATMSHEVRTPLNGIVGFASLLLDTPLSPEQQEYVETIRTSSETLIQLTGDILDYARIESGRLKLEPQPCDPRECIESALDLAAATALQKNIELLHWVDPAVPAAILADVGRLRQVLVNLVNNAVKFTPHGEVEVRLHTVAATPADEGSPPRVELEFSVRDTGIGIARAHHAKIFRPFSQADESTTRRFGGTGLGLAICKNIVGLMDGSISFVSEPGQGSTFSFRIRVPLPPEADLPPRAAPLPGRTLAVAIPAGGLRTELSQLATSLGAQVMETDPAALAGLSGWDLAVVDLSPAEATELRRRPDARPGLPADKMIALLPMSHAGELRNALRPHFRLVLSKPLHHEMFAGAVGAAALRPAAAATPPAPAHFDLRVLIVEDNPVNQRLTQQLVTHLGCAWTAAANGRIALDLLQQSPADVILMDLHMPELDGLSAIERIRAGGAGEAARHAWIIALTADARNELRAHTLRVGANDYLTKPVRQDTLRAALQRFLETDRRGTG